MPLNLFPSLINPLEEVIFLENYGRGHFSLKSAADIRDVLMVVECGCCLIKVVEGRGRWAALHVACPKRKSPESH